MKDITDRLSMYRDRPGRSSSGRELLAEAANTIEFLRQEVQRLILRLSLEKALRPAEPPEGDDET
jgi:hypothetical protein